jgi:hypothetical protein
MSKKKLPQLPVFDTPEEEDAFWQTHSPLDYAHEALGVSARRKFTRPTKASLTLHLTGEERKLLERVAAQVGERPTTLARRYIERGLQSDLKALSAQK